MSEAAKRTHKKRLGRSLASLIGEGEESEDAPKAGRFNPSRNFSILDSVASADASLGSYHDASLGAYYDGTLRVILTDVWRQKLLVLATIAAALVIGITLALVMPKRYTAEALVREGFADAVTYAKDGGERVITGERVIGLDASMLVETRSRLLQSQWLARRVVERLGLERIGPAVSEGLFSSWLRAKFYGDARAPGYPEDMAAERLLRGLSVTTEPRVYQIAVGYTAGDSEFAALITNAFVVEFLRTIRLQILSQQRNRAQQALWDDLATLGAKHPKVVDEKMRVEAADAAIKATLSKTSEEIERTAGGNVSFAQATTVPSSPNPPLLIGVALLVGLAGGIAIAALRGRSCKEATLAVPERAASSQRRRHKNKGVRRATPSPASDKELSELQMGGSCT
jgi:uncharacterized protein involved in exopolysaccharide biosynthesis